MLGYRDWFIFLQGLYLFHLVWFLTRKQLNSARHKLQTPSLGQQLLINPLLAQVGLV
jgi:hypothetical protein